MPAAAHNGLRGACQAAPHYARCVTCFRSSNGESIYLRRSRRKQQILQSYSGTGRLDRNHAFCRPLFLVRRTPDGEDLEEADLETAVSELLRRESHAYMTLWESLTKNEQRFLRGLADSETPPKPFSSSFTRMYGLRSASAAQRAAESLLVSDVIERESVSYVINDRFLRLWIRNMTS